MAVPGATTNYLTNGAGGTFVEAKQGGTILNNDDTGSVITKALTLLDGVAAAPDSNTLPSITASGIYNVAKALSAGTFAYTEAGKYVIARASDTLSGVSKTQLLTMGRGNTVNSIAQFYGAFGAKLLTAWRNNQFSWTGTLDSGAKITNMRINWLNSGGTLAASPDSLSRLSNAGGAENSAMYAPGGSTRNGTPGRAYFTDSAANGYVGVRDVNSDDGLAQGETGLRKIPGRLVIKSNFVDLNPWTSTKTTARPDFYNYKPITG